MSVSVSRTTKMKALTVVVVIAMIAAVRSVGAIRIAGLSANEIATPKPTATPVPTPTPTPASPYKDGTYTAIGSYGSPAGTQRISVTIRLSGGIVADSSVTAMADNSTSLQYQNDFITHYKAYVTGKAIATLNLGKVSLSSETPIGFNSSVTAIKGQAK
jgi:uncharacterized protein with FMN-binding domain